MVQARRNWSTLVAMACSSHGRDLRRRRLAAAAVTLAIASAHALSTPAVAQSSADSPMVLPMPPTPHPTRASAARQAAYREMRATWHLTSPGMAIRQHDRDLPPPPVQAERKQSTAAALPASRAPQKIEDRSPAAPGATVGGSGSPSPAVGAEQPEALPATWSADEIRDAEAACDDTLKSLSAEWDRLPPLRQGECGTPAPLRLRRIGSKSGVAINPPATTNCAVVARLYQWLETVAQPAAEKHFKSRIVALRNASSYMCRNRYNDPAAKISEHAFANALDIAAFELADGKVIDVETFWGKSVAARDTAAATGGESTPPLSPLSKPALKPRAVTIGLNATERKGEAPSATSRPDAATSEMHFLHTLHDGACGIFSTVLGPEANRAHHDHFHFDLKSRRGASYCE